MRKKTAMSRLLLGSTMSAMLLLSACSSAGSKDNPASPSPSSGAQELKPVELTVAFPVIGAPAKDIALVQDEVNKLTKAAINATVKLMPISYSNWNQQMNLMLSGNEKLDLTLGTLEMAAKGQLLPMDDLIASKGRGIAQALGETYLQGGKINGKLYGVASVRNLAADYGVVFRKDLVDKYNIDLSRIKTIGDLEPVLQLIKQKEPDVVPIKPGGLTFVDALPLGDPLGDGLGILPNYDNGLKVVNPFEMPEYADMLKLLRKWYEAGYVQKDSATTMTANTDLIKNGKLFAYTSGMKPGFASEQEKVAGTKLVSIELQPPAATTSNVTNVMWSLPRNAKEPERSVMLLNLMYTDARLVNLLDYGIEGKHYVKTPGTDNMVEFPPGLDSSNHPYNMDINWMMGNQFLSYVFKGNDPDIWKQTDAMNKSARKSKAFGFTFDPESVKSERTAVTNVVNQYKRGLETGTIDPDKNLPTFIAKLKDAGIDKIVAEKQKQLDAWTKTK